MIKWGVTVGGGVTRELSPCPHVVYFNTFLFLKLRKTIPKVQLSAWQINTGHEGLRVGRGLCFAKKPTKCAPPRFFGWGLGPLISSSFSPGEADEQDDSKGPFISFELTKLSI